MKLTMWLQLCNALANFKGRWQERTNQTPKRLSNSVRKSKIRPAPFMNGRGGLKEDRMRAKLDNPNWVYVPASSTDIRKTFHRELSRQNNKPLKVLSGGK